MKLNMTVVVIMVFVFGCSSVQQEERGFYKVKESMTSIPSQEVMVENADPASEVKPDQPPSAPLINPLEEEFSAIKTYMPRMSEVLARHGIPPKLEGERGLTVWIYDDPDCIRIFAFEKGGELAWAEFRPKDDSSPMSTKPSEITKKN